jgi:hypothetical protein
MDGALCPVTLILMKTKTYPAERRASDISVRVCVYVCVFRDSKVADELVAGKKKVFPAEAAHLLYGSMGFPIDLTVSQCSIITPYTLPTQKQAHSASFSSARASLSHAVHRASWPVRG